MSTPVSIGFVGGTGKLGRGLALRFAVAGRRVLIGSRSDERARAAAAALRERLASAGSAGDVEGKHNADVIPPAQIVFLTLPFESLRPFLEQSGTLLAGKLVVDVVNPLRRVDDRFELIPVPEGSAGACIQRHVPAARVVSAFKNAAAGHLLRLDRPAAGDILIASDDPSGKNEVAELVRAIPLLRPVDAGPLANAGLLEAVAALELNLNRIHQALTSIQVLGLRDDTQSSAS